MSNHRYADIQRLKTKKKLQPPPPQKSWTEQCQKQQECQVIFLKTHSSKYIFDYNEQTILMEL